MARVYLLEYGRAYTGSEAGRRAMRGTEQCTIGLAEALAAQGCEVWVFTGEESAEDHAGVRWRPERDARSGEAPPADLAIANNHASFFEGVPAREHAVWLHNPTSPHRALRKGDLRALLRFRPAAVMGSAEVDSRISRLMPFRRRLVIRHGLSPAFLAAAPERRDPPPPNALFPSLPHRGLDWLLETWAETVAHAAPDARLHCLIPPTSGAYVDRVDAAPFAEFLPPKTSGEMAALLRETRVLISIGHKDETFCLVAAEAHALGVPVMTRGIGALKERVRDGVDGYVRRDPQEFGDRLTALLTDDALWGEMHGASYENPDRAGWSDRAAEWIDAFGLGGGGRA